MAVTAEVRSKRMKQEYLSLRDAQDDIMDNVDTLETAILRLTEIAAESREQIRANNAAMAENRELIRANSAAIVENRELIRANSAAIVESREMLQSIIDHLKVPYEKPPMGFKTEG